MWTSRKVGEFNGYQTLKCTETGKQCPQAKFELHVHLRSLFLGVRFFFFVSVDTIDWGLLRIMLILLLLFINVVLVYICSEVERSSTLYMEWFNAVQERLLRAQGGGGEGRGGRPLF